MNTKSFKNIIFTCVIYAMVAIPVAADGLADGKVNSIDNNGSFVNKVNGIDFNLNAGTTNINWDKLNVSGNETLNYIFNAANSTAFNKVNALNGPSVIAGAVNASGIGAATSSIIISNAAGVTFVNGAVVNVGALTVLSDADINVNGLTVKNGDLNFESTSKGQVNINGVRYDNKGDLYVSAKNGDISVANILNANNIDLTAKKGDVLIGGSTVNVGGKKIDGVTAEYFAVNAQNGKVNVTGKVTVGKDFNVIAKTNDGIHFDNATVNTKNGSFTIKNNNANAKISFADSSIKSSDGKIKLVSKNIDMSNSKIDNVQIDSAHSVVIDRSKLTNTVIKEVNDLLVKNISAKNDTLVLNGINVKGTLTSEKSLINLSGSIINNSEFIGGSISASGTSFNSLKAGLSDPLWSDNVGITLNDCVVGYFQAQGHITDLVNTSVDNLVTDSVIVNASSTNGTKSTIKTASISGGVLNTDNYSVTNVLLNGTANFKNSDVQEVAASGSSVIKADATNISKISTNNGSFRTLSLSNSSTVGSLMTTSINNVVLNNVTRDLSGLKIANLDSVNSIVSVNNSVISNSINAKGGSLNLSNATVNNNLIIDDTLLSNNNSQVNANVYLTKSSGNDITSSDINEIMPLMNGKNSELYLGYTPDMGNYSTSPVSISSSYTGNVNLNNANAIDMNNKKIFVSTSGDVNLNLMNTKSLIVENSNSAVISSVNNGVNQALTLDKIVSQNNIDITVDTLSLASGSVKGLIDSKIGEVKFNGLSNVTVSDKMKDSANRTYIEMTVDSNMYDVYGSVIAGLTSSPISTVTPVVPVNPAPQAPVNNNSNSSTIQNDTTIASYVNTLKVDSSVYNMPSNSQSLANQFARNVRSLAVDSNTTKEATVSEIQNGLRLETKIMP